MPEPSSGLSPDRKDLERYVNGLGDGQLIQVFDDLDHSHMGFFLTLLKPERALVLYDHYADGPGKAWMISHLSAYQLIPVIHRQARSMGEPEQRVFKRFYKAPLSVSKMDLTVNLLIWGILYRFGNISLSQRRDLHSDAFLQIWNRLCSNDTFELKGEEAFAGYIITTAENAALNYLRNYGVKHAIYADDIDTYQASHTADQALLEWDRKKMYYWFSLYLDEFLTMRDLLDQEIFHYCIKHDYSAPEMVARWRTRTGEVITEVAVRQRKARLRRDLRDHIPDGLKKNLQESYD